MAVVHSTGSLIACIGCAVSLVCSCDVSAGVWRRSMGRSASSFADEGGEADEAEEELDFGGAPSFAAAGAGAGGVFTTGADDGELGCEASPGRVSRGGPP